MLAWHAGAEKGPAPVANRPGGPSPDGPSVTKGRLP